MVAARLTPPRRCMMSTAATLAADRARNAEIEAELLHLQHRISMLQIEQAPIQQRLDSYTYPVLTLPNEIVSEIFIHVLPVYPLCPPMLGRLSPNLLAQICRKWREIALSTPRLWSAISLEYNPLEWLPMLESWLNRSGSCPLSIQLDGGGWNGYIPQIFAALVPHRARWEYLKISDISLSDVLTIEGPMSLLCDLHIEAYDSVLAPAAVFRQAPRLLAFTDTRFHYITYPPEFLPWLQLTSVTLVFVTPDECAPILIHTVNLVHCQLAMTSGPLNQSDIELACLESLVLVKYSDGPLQLTQYLNTFIVPALRRLQVPDECLWRNPIDILQSFISKSGCQLQEVCITGKRSVSRASYRRAFPSIPSFTFNRALIHWGQDEGSGDGESEEESDAEGPEE
ncbi:hypothetical protein C8R44DRAFT_856059 [Mycena epipterygia]|nr:hypothetical protein C8R44DRAFT_856059 [Mycena epipterygia]